MIQNNMKTVTITEEEYKELKHNALKLSALESFGVDNWCGYDDAMQQYQEWLEEENE